MPSHTLSRFYVLNVRAYHHVPPYRALSRRTRSLLRPIVGRPRGVRAPLRDLTPIADHVGIGHGPWRLPAGYVSRDMPTYYHCVDVGILHQPDVYGHATRLGAALGARRIIDLGCGSGEHLVAMRGAGWDTIGIDYGPNIQAARTRWPDYDWREADFDSHDPLPLSSQDLNGAVLVSADVIEHLRSPERHLRAVAQSLPSASLLILSTPERERLGGSPLGPPVSSAHVREWTGPELAHFMASCGLEHGFIGLTRTEDWTSRYATSCAVVAPPSLDLGDLRRHIAAPDPFAP